MVADRRASVVVPQLLAQQQPGDVTECAGQVILLIAAQHPVFVQGVDAPQGGGLANTVCQSRQPDRADQRQRPGELQVQFAAVRAFQFIGQQTVERTQRHLVFLVELKHFAQQKCLARALGNVLPELPSINPTAPYRHEIKENIRQPQHHPGALAYPLRHLCPPLADGLPP